MNKPYILYLSISLVIASILMSSSYLFVNRYNYTTDHKSRINIFTGDRQLLANFKYYDSIGKYNQYDPSIGKWSETTRTNRIKESVDWDWISINDVMKDWTYDSIH